MSNGDGFHFAWPQLRFCLGQKHLPNTNQAIINPMKISMMVINMVGIMDFEMLDEILLVLGIIYLIFTGDIFIGAAIILFSFVVKLAKGENRKAPPSSNSDDQYDTGSDEADDDSDDATDDGDDGDDGGDDD